jgi:hypothetical protein
MRVDHPKGEDTQYWKCTHKYGVELPKSVKQGLAIDRNTGTSFWKDAIKKEMRNIQPLSSSEMRT